MISWLRACLCHIRVYRNVFGWGWGFCGSRLVYVRVLRCPKNRSVRKWVWLYVNSRHSRGSLSNSGGWINCEGDIRLWESVWFVSEELIKFCLDASWFARHCTAANDLMLRRKHGRQSRNTNQHDIRAGECPGFFDMSDGGRNVSKPASYPFSCCFCSVSVFVCCLFCVARFFWRKTH